MKFNVGDEIIQNVPSGVIQAKIIGTKVGRSGFNEYVIELMSDHYHYKKGFTWEEGTAVVDIIYSFKNPPSHRIYNMQGSIGNVSDAVRAMYERQYGCQYDNKPRVPECICGGTKMGYKPGRQHSSFMKCPLYKE